LNIYEETFGAEHPNTILIMNNLRLLHKDTRMAEPFEEWLVTISGEGALPKRPAP
jgi:hypothetical protein